MKHSSRNFGIETRKRMIKMFVATRRGVSLQTFNILLNFKQMKKLTIIFIIIMCTVPTLTTLAQPNVITENRKEKNLYFGIGFGFGFFYPSDVNDYIKANTKDIIITSGIEDLFLNLVGRVSLTYRINKTIDISLIGEYAWAPKYISVSGGDDEYFHFDRVSPGFIAKFHIPIGSGKHSIFLAPGLLYNFMKFEEFKANAIGARLEAGLSFNFGKFNLQPFICYDYIKATDNSYIPEFELNYSGAQIGVDFNF